MTPAAFKGLSTAPSHATRGTTKKKGVAQPGHALSFPPLHFRVATNPAWRFRRASNTLHSKQIAPQAFTKNPTDPRRPGSPHSKKQTPLPPLQSPNFVPHVRRQYRPRNSPPVLRTPPHSQSPEPGRRRSKSTSAILTALRNNTDPRRPGSPHSKKQTPLPPLQSLNFVPQVRRQYRPRNSPPVLRMPPHSQSPEPGETGRVQLWDATALPLTQPTPDGQVHPTARSKLPCHPYSHPISFPMFAASTVPRNSAPVLRTPPNRNLLNPGETDPDSDPTPHRVPLPPTSYS